MWREVSDIQSIHVTGFLHPKNPRILKLLSFFKSSCTISSYSQQLPCFGRFIFKFSPIMFVIGSLSSNEQNKTTLLQMWSTWDVVIGSYINLSSFCIHSWQVSCESNTNIITQQHIVNLSNTFHQKKSASVNKLRAKPVLAILHVKNIHTGDQNWTKCILPVIKNTRQIRSSSDHCDETVYCTTLTTEKAIHSYRIQQTDWFHIR